MMKRLEDKLSQISETRSREKAAAPADAKGRPPLRARPDDFEIIFVEIGRIDCEIYYRAARITVDRWLEESGKARLIDKRAAFVAHMRVTARKPKQMPIVVKPAKDRRIVSICVARLAANYLRHRRGGGWHVSPTGLGDWFVGTQRKTSGQLLDFAIDKGFDLSIAELTCNFTDSIEGGR